MTLSKTLARLLLITDGCREDMHEPDEQGIECQVKGNHLDNAMGENPDHSKEFTVGITRNGKTEWFNLANLIALARTANEATEFLYEVESKSPHQRRTFEKSIYALTLDEAHKRAISLAEDYNTSSTKYKVLRIWKKGTVIPSLGT